MIDYRTFVNNSRTWLNSYIQDNNLKSLVIGISGGIDSTISAAIASEVCKAREIPLIGRSLPTTTNKIEESRIAFKVGEAFCTDFKTVNISHECDYIINGLEVTEGEMTALQKGNVKARYRMMYLRNLASIHKGVVLDNDNFTEWNLGFWTIGGDSPMDINLGLHYLWKTEIYELADYLRKEYLNEYAITKDGYEFDKYLAINESIELTPTDGNGVSKSDCEQFGLDNYGQVDDVLQTMYYSTQISPDFRGFQENPIRELEYTRLIDSYNEQGVDKVMILHQNTEFKRKPSPVMPTRKELGI